MISGKIAFEQRYETRDGTDITLLNIYAPPGYDFCFFKKIFAIIVTHSEGVLVYGGDLNIHLQPKLDLSNHTHTPKAVSKKFSELMKDIGFIDIWR